MIKLLLSLILGSGSKDSLVRATHYGPKFEGRKMANGHIYLHSAMTAATNQFPLGSIIRAVNMTNGKGVYVTVTDRTSKTKHGKPVFDLSLRAFDALGINRKKGWGWVTVQEIDPATLGR